MYGKKITSVMVVVLVLTSGPASGYHTQTVEKNVGYGTTDVSTTHVPTHEYECEKLADRLTGPYNNSISARDLPQCEDHNEDKEDSESGTKPVPSESDESNTVEDVRLAADEGGIVVADGDRVVSVTVIVEVADVPDSEDDVGGDDSEDTEGNTDEGTDGNDTVEDDTGQEGTAPENPDEGSNENPGEQDDSAESEPVGQFITSKLVQKYDSGAEEELGTSFEQQFKNAEDVDVDVDVDEDEVDVDVDIDDYAGGVPAENNLESEMVNGLSTEYDQYETISVDVDVDENDEIEIEVEIEGTSTDNTDDQSSGSDEESPDSDSDATSDDSDEQSEDDTDTDSDESEMPDSDSDGDDDGDDDENEKQGSSTPYGGSGTAPSVHTGAV